MWCNVMSYFSANFHPQAMPSQSPHHHSLTIFIVYGDIGYVSATDVLYFCGCPGHAPRHPAVSIEQYMVTTE